MTRKEKAIIRSWFASYHAIRFSGGKVFAKRNPGDSWGVLYTEYMLDRHLAVIRNS